MKTGGRARAEHTSIMLVMSVTLDVSKLSGWLKADARCESPKKAHTTWGEVPA